MSGAAGSGGNVSTEISYCPHLGMYRYRKADGSDFMFDTLQLEQSIDLYTKNADTRQAEFMIWLTALARQYPHQVISFNEQGESVIRPLTPAELPTVEDDPSPATG